MSIKIIDKLIIVNTITGTEELLVRKTIKEY